jgi:cytochrome c553
MSLGRLAAIGLVACGLSAAARWAEAASLSIWDGVYTATQAERGATDYASHCVECHGESLTGNGGEVPPLSGKPFLYKWDGLALQVLFDRIHMTMPQNNPGTLSGQEAADLTAYLLSFNQIPAGAAELSDAAQGLENIQIDAKRPSH